ncbi:MAG: hypothetical protein ACJA2B_000075 [Candidatus Endobugula sp.]
MIAKYTFDKNIKLIAFYILGFCVFMLLMSHQVSADKAFSFELHPQAQVLNQSSYQEKDYIVALDKYRKTDDRWVPRKWQRQSGELQRYTLEMPRDYVEADVFNYYQEQVPSNAELLFTCEGRQCGESNNWANDHFGVKQLYGANASQKYSVYRVSYPAVVQNVTEEAGIQQVADMYITLYTVRRGNRRLYTQLDILHVH